MIILPDPTAILLPDPTAILLSDPTGYTNFTQRLRDDCAVGAVEVITGIADDALIIGASNGPTNGFRA